MIHYSGYTCQGGLRGGAHTSRPRADSVWSHAQFPHFEPLIVYRVSYSRCGVGYIVNHTLKWGKYNSYICQGLWLIEFYRANCTRSQFPSLWGCFECHMRVLGGESKKISKTCSLRPLAHIGLNYILFTFIVITNHTKKSGKEWQ